MARSKAIPRKAHRRSASVSQPSCRRADDEVFLEVASHLNGFSQEAIVVLRRSVRQYIDELMADAEICANFSGRDTITPRDILLARRVRGERV
jgi:histone H3/H4